MPVYDILLFISPVSPDGERRGRRQGGVRVSAGDLKCV